MIKNDPLNVVVSYQETDVIKDAVEINTPETIPKENATATKTAIKSGSEFMFWDFIVETQWFVCFDTHHTCISYVLHISFSQLNH